MLQVVQKSKLTLIPLLLSGAFGLAACDDGITPYVFSPNTIIATNHDTGQDKGGLLEGDAAVPRFSTRPDSVQATKVPAVKVPVSSAQLKSALLLAGMAGNVRVAVREPAGRSRDHTERMLKALGFPIETRDGWIVLQAGGPVQVGQPKAGTLAGRHQPHQQCDTLHHLAAAGAGWGGVFIVSHHVDHFCTPAWAIGQ